MIFENHLGAKVFSGRSHSDPSLGAWKPPVLWASLDLIPREDRGGFQWKIPREDRLASLPHFKRSTPQIWSIFLSEQGTEKIISLWFRCLDPTARFCFSPVSTADIPDSWRRKCELVQDTNIVVLLLSLFQKGHRYPYLTYSALRGLFANGFEILGNSMLSHIIAEYCKESNMANLPPAESVRSLHFLLFFLLFFFFSSRQFMFLKCSV